MNFNFGFIILSPDFNIGGLKNTLRSIKHNYEKTEVLCCVNNKIKNEQLKEMKDNCNVHKGGKTITSLINKGFEKLTSDWGVLILEGSRVCKNLNLKYGKWIKNYNDILFPLVVEYDREMYPKKIYDTFYNCTINGICINKKFYKETGDLSEDGLEESRKIWTIQALEKKAVFKSILGIKIC